GNTVAFSRVHQLPAEAEQDKGALTRLGIRSGIIIPFSGQSGVLGAVSFELLDEERAWPELLVKRLELIAKVFADTTARQQAEESLKACTNEFITLKAALDEHAMVAITDPHGKITSVNDKICAISKYSREELVGHDYRMLISGDYAEEFFSQIRPTL